jgi:pimeloyl-ACP methyl ester carboxylesterase
MDIATFHSSRRFADVKSGRIAYFERGQGAVALFVHGVPINGYHWRHVIDRVQHRRRCIAIDLMGLGYTEIGPSQDVSFTAQAQMIAEVLDKLGIEQSIWSATTVRRRHRADFRGQLPAPADLAGADQLRCP